MEAEWVRSLRAQCHQAGVAFFFKQWGGARKKITGRKLDGKTYSEFPARQNLQIMPEAQRRSAIAELSPPMSIDVPLVALAS